MNRMKALSRILLLAAAVAAMLPVVPAAAQPIPQDVITVGTVSGAAGATVNVPVYIRDVSATPLGIDQPAGSRIQSYSIKVDYALAANVSAITFTRAGITAGLTPAFESSPASPGSISLLDNFVEATNLIPFVSNAAAPGNLVGTLQVTVAPGVAPGTTITLTLDPTLTQLTDEGGTPATVETTANGRLALVSGAINVAAQASQVPTLGGWALALLAMALAFVAVRVAM